MVLPGSGHRRGSSRFRALPLGAFTSGRDPCPLFSFSSAISSSTTVSSAESIERWAWMQVVLPCIQHTNRQRTPSCPPPPRLTPQTNSTMFLPAPSHNHCSTQYVRLILHYSPAGRKGTFLLNPTLLERNFLAAFSRL